ncbi:MAG TPA: DUF2804 family protein [Solirubrobacteraceae bacterium]|nr:DUF2804 family protein [Solirubrobacteraceae bacterium]
MTGQSTQGDATADAPTRRPVALDHGHAARRADGRGPARAVGAGARRADAEALARRSRASITAAACRCATGHRARVAAGWPLIEIGSGKALSIVDDTAGSHARATEWWWSAGVGRAADGSPVGWNLVAGVNDGPVESERSVWVAGAAHEVEAVRFEADLSAVCFATGERLRFEAEAVRARHDRLLIVESEYRQPFGTFTGRLPGAGELADGLGVMEHHRARW